MVPTGSVVGGSMTGNMADPFVWTSDSGEIVTCRAKPLRLDRIFAEETDNWVGQPIFHFA